jgi:hypothetical protein
MHVRGIVDHVSPIVAPFEAAPPDPDTDPPAAGAPLFPDGSDTSQDGGEWSSPSPVPILSYRPSPIDRGALRQASWLVPDATTPHHEVRSTLRGR